MAVVRCAHCSSEVTVPDDPAARPANCPNCGGALTAVARAARPVRPPRPDDEDDRPARRREREGRDEDDRRERRPQKKSSLGLILGIVAGVLVLGCAGCAGVGYWMFAKTRDAVQETRERIEVAQSAAQTGPAGTRPAEQPSVVTLPADELFQNRAQYDGKWVTVVARMPRIHLDSYPDGRVEARVDLMGESGRSEITGRFASSEWKQAPKIEDEVRYEIVGLFEKGIDVAQLKWCRVVRARPRTKTGPAPVGTAASVTADALAADPAKYLGQSVALTATVTAADPVAGTVRVKATGKIVRLTLPAADFNQVVSAGHGCNVEVRGRVTGHTNQIVAVTADQLVRATAAALQTQAVNFAREFSVSAEKAEAKYKDKPVRLTGVIESFDKTATGVARVTLRGYTAPKLKVEPKGRPAPKSVKVVCAYGTDWGHLFAKRKVGDTVTLSGEFSTFADGEVAVNSCWLVP